MKIRSLLLLLLAALWHTPTAAQDTDSLYAAWSDTQQHDTVRLEAMETLLWNIQYADPDSSERCAHRMLALAEKAASDHYQASALELLANSHYIRGDVQKAIGFYQQCLQLHVRHKNPVGVAGSMGNLGSMYTELGQFDQARRFQDLGLELYTQLGNEEGMGQGNNNIGRILLIQGDLAGAAGYLLKSITHNEKAGNKRGVLSGYGNLSVVMAQQKDFARATEYALRGLAIAEELNNQQARSSFLTNLGGFAVEDKRYDEGIAYHEKSLALAREMGNKAGEALALYNIGSAAGEFGQHHRAYELMQGSLRIAHEMQEPYREALALSGLAAAAQGLGRHAEAIEHGEKALTILKGIGATVDIGAVAAVLRKAYQSSGRSDRALAMYELEVQMEDSVTNEEAQRGVLRQEYSFENEKRALADSLQFAAQEQIQRKEIQKQKVIRNGFVGGFALVALFAAVFFFQRNRISKEKARSEELLLNILPAEVAEELKAKGQADAVQIDQVTVLFTDFKGFTALSERVTPKELVRDLNECFSAFDKITGKYGIEKIKTIGDSYMAAGGLPTPNTTHATDVINAALEMRDFIAEGKARKMAAGLPYFEVRIGVHTGPVVAGIVGVKKFQYDIWGDTVNTASRMESSGEPGMVNVSEATYRVVVGTQVSEVSSQVLGVGHGDGSRTTDDQQPTTPAFTFTPRGKVHAKGKGEMEMFFVSRTIGHKGDLPVPPVWL